MVKYIQLKSGGQCRNKIKQRALPARKGNRMALERVSAESWDYSRSPSGESWRVHVRDLDSGLYTRCGWEYRDSRTGDIALGVYDDSQWVMEAEYYNSI